MTDRKERENDDVFMVPTISVIIPTIQEKIHSNNLIQKLKQKLDVKGCDRIGFSDSDANVSHRLNI